MQDQKRDAVLESGTWMGCKRAFASLAGGCSAADAECLRQMRARRKIASRPRCSLPHGGNSSSLDSGPIAAARRGAGDPAAPDGLEPILFTYKAIWWGKRSVCVVCRAPKATDHERRWSHKVNSIGPRAGYVGRRLAHARPQREAESAYALAARARISRNLGRIDPRATGSESGWPRPKYKRR